MGAACWTVLMVSMGCMERSARAVAKPPCRHGIMGLGIIPSP
jgi:hypothetical protein